MPVHVFKKISANYSKVFIFAIHFKINLIINIEESQLYQSRNLVFPNREDVLIKVK